MERLTQTSDKGGVAFTFDLDVTCHQSEMKKILKIAEKLKEYEDLEELIGIPLEKIAEIFNNNIPEECKYPKKAITLTDDDVDRWNGYKNAEEQGLLLRLPCKVGDAVYAYCSEFGILLYTVDCIVIDEHITYQCSSYSEPIGDCPSECLDEIEPDISEFGKTVFLTQAEAEQKLWIP